MRLIGIDLAWQADKNSSALAVGKLEGKHLQLKALEPQLLGITNIVNTISHIEGVKGIAIDASLIINNPTGQRACEKALAADYASKKAACHPTNLALYPDPLTVKLANILQEKGFMHIAGHRWQIECYPHPAIIECFGLPERLLYKKGRVEDKRAGQLKLASMITRLQHSKVLSLTIPNSLIDCVSAEHINSLKGHALKVNEDALDAIICLYIAGLYHIKAKGQLYGDAADGYIWVPKIKCISE